MKVSKNTLPGFLRRLIAEPIKFFALASLIFGLTFIILIPPFQIPDEFIHFTRAYEVSELKTAHRHQEEKVAFMGSDLPKSILLTHKATRLTNTPGYPDVPQAKKYTHSKTKAAFSIPLDKNKLEFYNTNASPAYVPIVYLPQAIAIKLLSLLNSPAILMLYAVRFVGLLVWIGLAVVALRILQPKYRLPMAGLLLLPMFLAQASPSTDPLLNGAALVFLAIVATAIASKTILSRNTMLILVGLLTLMVMAKPVYLAFGLLLAALPAKRLDLKTLGYRAACLAVPFLLYFGWSFVTKNDGGAVYVDSVAISNADPSAQADYIIPEVYNFFEPFMNTLLLGWGNSIYVSLIGDFGKLDTPLPLFFVALGYTFVLVAIFAGLNPKQDEKDDRVMHATKLTALSVIAATTLFIVGIYLAMYIYSTPPEEKIVTGVQGRYLLPLLPLLLLFVPKHWVTMKKKAYTTILTVAPILLLLVSAVIIWMRFYIVYPS